MAINIYHIYCSKVQDFPGQVWRGYVCRRRTHNILAPITIDFPIVLQQDVVLLLIYVMYKSMNTCLVHSHRKNQRSGLSGNILWMTTWCALLMQWWADVEEYKQETINTAHPTYSLCKTKAHILAQDYPHPPIWTSGRPFHISESIIILLVLSRGYQRASGGVYPNKRP